MTFQKWVFSRLEKCFREISWYRILIQADLGDTGQFDELSGDESYALRREELVKVLASIDLEPTEEFVRNGVGRDGNRWKSGHIFAKMDTSASQDEK